MKDIKRYQPVSAVEKELLRIWKDVLKKDDIALNDDFFKIGGNSLYAIKIFGKMSAVFEVSMNDLFACTTIEELSKHISFRKGGRAEELNALKNLAKKMDAYRIPENEQKLLDEYESKSANLQITAKRKHSCVFITGICGYFGANYLEKVLTMSEAKVIGVVRSKSDEAAWSRLSSVMNYYFPDKNIMEVYGDRIRVYAGDLGEEKFGLSGELYDCIANEADCILHGAGLVKHFGAWEEFEKVNVDVTRKMIQLAKEGRAKRLCFISTMGAAYTKDRFVTKIPFTEYEFPQGEIDDNFYLRSKTMAEQLVREASKSGLDAKIFRLGYLTQSDETGVFQINADENAFFRLLSAVMKIGVVPDSKAAVFDFTFIDGAAKAAHMLSEIDDSLNVYHIFNPDQVSVLRIAQLMNECGENIRITDIDDFIAYLSENTDKYPEEITDVLLSTYVLEPEIDQTLVLKIRCSRTAALLKKLGFVWKCVDKKHMTDVIRVLNKSNNS